jgi:hypothetical protein
MALPAADSVDTIRALTDANRRAPDARVEERLVGLRHTAFDAIDRRPPSDVPWPVTARAPSGGLPELRAANLTAKTLRDGLAHEGCVFVPRLIPSARAETLARGIDRALAGFDASVSSPSGSTSPWYAPFNPTVGRYRVGGRRNWVRASGALWTADSPRMLFELCELIDDTGIGALVTDYLGERPALSANKCTLRRVPVDTATNWHQDGAFLGAEVRTLNLWLALSDCGDDSPGLEIVPRRFDTVLETGTDGAMFDWSVSPNVVDEIAKTTPVLRPHFRAGDALLFDHMFLHRTAAGPGMTRERHAMETWFFAPSSYPDGQIPLVY